MLTLDNVKEVYYGIYSLDKVKAMIASGDALLFKAKRPVLISTNCLLKVNMNIGVSNADDYDKEIEKLVTIAGLP